MITKQQTPPSFTLVKTIRSHAGHGRYLSETAKNPIAWLANVQCEGIPSPYSYSPSRPVWLNEGTGQKVVIFETSHRCYQVFEISPQLLTFKTDDAATDWHIRFSRKSA
jgi:hypothetical protein